MLQEPSPSSPPRRHRSSPPAASTQTPPWRFVTNALSNDAERAEIMDAQGARLTFSEVLQLLADDRAFQLFFNQVLADASFVQFYFECPPVSKGTANSLPYEHVHIRCGTPFAAANSEMFGEHFTRAPRSALATRFANLGGDAMLVAPCPHGPKAACGHIGEFVRHASREQQAALWQTVGRTLLQTLNERPTWLCTEGSGVPWLHVRLDSSPKYYKHREYAAPPSDGTKRVLLVRHGQGTHNKPSWGGEQCDSNVFALASSHACSSTARNSDLHPTPHHLQGATHSTPSTRDSPSWGYNRLRSSARTTAWLMST
eukprot:3909452-Prymnesium_polylepis.1